MKNTTTYNHHNCSIQEESINDILDSGLNNLTYNFNPKGINSTTYTMNHDMTKQQYNSNELLSNNNKTYTTTTSCPMNLTKGIKADDESMIYLIEYRQKLACRDNELHAAKIELNNQLHLNAELNNHLCQNDAIIKEKECIILNQMKDIDELHSYKENYCKLRCDYDHLLAEYENSERIRNEQKMLIIALQRDIDTIREKSFNTINEIQYQQEGIEKDKIRRKIDEMILSKEKDIKKSKSLNMSSIKSPNRSISKTITQSPTRNNYISNPKKKNATTIKNNSNRSKIQSNTARSMKHKLNKDLPKNHLKKQQEQIPSYMK